MMMTTNAIAMNGQHNYTNDSNDIEQPTLSPPTQFPCARTEIVRRPVSAGGFYDNAPEKVFRGLLTPDGSLQLSVDFERDGN
eukprot:CAMPEP_0178792678 /NCGR_PEP_ID=MMETSP0745-20121128/8661_1 /TAXON_ID=913974 /ORGANISM="Nitzschia punctata, Strain CCMP561" /LENGTH=81 /DNA_ID=CAMNT_0020450901 /DNA_START=17 /DNA_END=262 /DNA_ORIENTATION=-